MRTIPTLALFGALLATQAVAADECGPLQMVNTVRMIRIPGSNVDLVPVTLNGVAKSFLLDTGGNLTQIQRKAAEELKLPISHDGAPLYSLTGAISRDLAHIQKFTLGRMQGANVNFPISPIIEAGSIADGILAPDYLEAYDTDVDFGNDTLNLFSPDHCPGGVLYWKAPTVATVTMIRQGLEIIVPVTLDGHQIRAMLDTGSTNSALRMDIAQHTFGLALGTGDTPENGGLNGDASLKTYRHVFKSLSFGGVTVGNPGIVIIPNAAGRNAERNQLTASRAKTEKDLVNTPELIIGMDVLRKLHIYMAFREKKLYVSPTSASPPPMAVTAAAPPLSVPQRAATEIAFLNTEIAARPDDAELFNRRCFMRGLTGQDLNAALADCDQALRLKPGTVAFLDRRAMILYLQGKYRAALNAYNEILKVEPGYPASLLVRGYAKGRLGDRAGRDTDVASAKAGNPNIEATYQRIGINK